MTVGIDETMQDYTHKLERARMAKQLESGKKRRRKAEPPAEAGETPQGAAPADP